MPPLLDFLNENKNLKEGEVRNTNKIINIVEK
jgi:hypothetical protein